MSYKHATLIQARKHSNYFANQCPSLPRLAVYSYRGLYSKVLQCAVLLIPSHPQSTLQAMPSACIQTTLTKGKTLSGTMKYIVNTDKFKQVVSTHTCHHFIDKWATKSCKYGGLEGKDTK